MHFTVVNGQDVSLHALSPHNGLLLTSNAAMPELSPYADAESGTPEWKTGEKETAVAFISLTLYIILDVNFGIYRIFRRKQGLYYWSLIFATWGTAVVAVGNILKNLKPEWGVIWPLWTLMINGGWSVYAPAELLVLYSRLHLVNQNDRLHRWLLIMIIVASFSVIVPNWVFIFGAYDVDPKVSSVWSPRMAIIDRTSQASFTVMEAVISGVYIHSLLGILRTKVDIRTRRVMRDLIGVNVSVVVMDLLVIILIFLNQAQVAYPMQDFTYALKYKIEFVVLNQLMAIATKGSRTGMRNKSTFEQRRYRRPSRNFVLTGYSDDNISGLKLPFLSTLPTDSQGAISIDEKLQQHRQQPYAQRAKDDDPARTAIAKPERILSKSSGDTANNTTKLASIESLDKETEPSYDIRNYDFSSSPSLDLSLPPSSSDRAHPPFFPQGQPQGQESDDALLAPVADDVNDAYLPNALASPPAKKQAQHNSLRQILFRRKNMNHEPENNTVLPTAKFTEPKASNASDTNAVTSLQSQSDSTARGLRRKRRANRPSDDNDSDEEGVHTWERSKRLTAKVPWFYKEVSGE